MRDQGFQVLPPHLDKVELRAAVDAIDDWADTNAASFNIALPLQYRTSATADQKALLFAAVLMRRAGVFRSEEDG